jgi:hypothetical protein
MVASRIKYGGKINKFAIYIPESHYKLYLCSHKFLNRLNKKKRKN